MIHFSHILNKMQIFSLGPKNKIIPSSLLIKPLYVWYSGISPAKEKPNEQTHFISLLAESPIRNKWLNSSQWNHRVDLRWRFFRREQIELVWPFAFTIFPTPFSCLDHRHDARIGEDILLSWREKHRVKLFAKNGWKEN